MDRRRLHRIAMIGGGLVLVAGAVLVLRDPDAKVAEQSPPPPGQPTSVQPFADESVIVPVRGERPAAPARLDIRPGPHRLVAGWGPGRTGAAEPVGATGYEVRWGSRRQPERTRLVAEPVIQLDGLDDDTEYRIEVRTVDSFGQRSEPAAGTGTPSERPADPTAYTFVDRFDGRVVPDPARWRLTGVGSCTKAARGDGEDARRLVIIGGCGDSAEAVTLRSRTPLRLRDPATAPDGELGRFVVGTDRPAGTEELTLDLVPGPADMIGRQPRGEPADTPGRAAVDDSLPPGTIRVSVTGRRAGPAVVRVLVAPGTPLLGAPVGVQPVPPTEIGVSVRWEVVLRTDGVGVLRDGVLVGGGDVVPAFTEATALVGFAGSTGGLRAAVDLVGFTGSPTATPPLVLAPRVDFDRAVAGPATATQTSGAGRPLPGILSGQLRITLASQREQVPGDQFTVDIGGQRIAARPAVAGQPLRPGARLPVVADIPGPALVVEQHADVVTVVVHSSVEEDGLATQVLAAELELTGTVAPAGRTVNQPLPRPNSALAEPAMALLDAAGTPVPTLQDVPRGRLVLEVTMDAAAAQRRSGAVAGLAGVQISLDNRPLAGIPTDAGGPGVGGHWRLALNTTELAAGSHTLALTAVGTDPTTSFAISYASFVVR